LLLDLQCWTLYNNKYYKLKEDNLALLDAGHCYRKKSSPPGGRLARLDFGIPAIQILGGRRDFFPFFGPFLFHLIEVLFLGLQFQFARLGAAAHVAVRPSVLDTGKLYNTEYFGRKSSPPGGRPSVTLTRHWDTCSSNLGVGRIFPLFGLFSYTLLIARFKHCS